jgi:diguanylate cyclase (GGDEF)-like protein
MNRRFEEVVYLNSFEERIAVWARWAVLFLAVLLLSLRPQETGARYFQAYLTIGAGMVYNLAVFMTGRNRWKFLKTLWLNLLFDLVFATLLIISTLGPQSQFFYLYYLAIFLAAISGNRWTAMQAATLAGVMYLTGLGLSGELHWDRLSLYDLLFKGGLLALAAFWAGMLSDQQKGWQKRNRELSRMADQWSKTATDIQSAALFGMGALLSSSHNIEETLNLTLDAVEDLLGADRCSILLLDQGTDELVLRASRGVRAGAVGKLRLKSDQGVAGQALRTGQPQNIPDTDKEPLFVPSPKHYKNRIRSMLVVPLIVGEKRIGVINISEVRASRVFTAGEMSSIKLVASYTALALLNAGIMEEKEREATTDDLTGLHNYRHFSEEFSRRLGAWRPGDPPLSLIWMDLDHFKEYNDNFGHLKGSEILKRLGGILKTAVGMPEAVYFRYGGDEFAVILPGAGRSQAVEKAEKVRALISRTEFAERRPEGRQLSASIGVATCPDNGRGYRELVERADQAMYYAKENGKNRVAFWQSNAMTINRRKE